MTEGVGGSGRSADRPLAELEARLRQMESLVAVLGLRVDELEGRGADLRSTLARLGDVLSATHDREAIVAAVLEAGAHHLRARAGAFYVIVPGAERLRTVAACGGTADAAVPAELVMGEGVAGRAASTGQVVVEGANSDDTAVAVPVAVRGRRYGVITLYGRAVEGPFSPADVETLVALGHQVEPAIENTFLYEEAQRLSITDGLTSLWNRRHFDLRVNAEWQRANRFREPFSIVVLDVDRFKAINDTYGHQAGDAVLIGLAQRVIGAVRDVDVVARLGGEEFGMILPSTPVDGAHALVERVREAVAGQPFDSGEGREITVTVSAGVAAWPHNGSTPRELLAAADTALYAAKEGGRNLVLAAAPMTAEPTPPPSSLRGTGR